jgi:hypothetical protein
MKVKIANGFVETSRLDSDGQHHWHAVRLVSSSFLASCPARIYASRLSFVPSFGGGSRSLQHNHIGVSRQQM